MLLQQYEIYGLSKEFVSIDHKDHKNQDDRLDLLLQLIRIGQSKQHFSCKSEWVCQAIANLINLYNKVIILIQIQLKHNFLQNQKIIAEVIRYCHFLTTSKLLRNNHYFYHQPVYTQCYIISALKIHINYIINTSKDMKSLPLCLILTFLYISVVVAQVPVVFSYSPYAPLPRITAGQVSNLVDEFIRTKYFYYLPYANICYVSHSNCAEGFLFIHIYKNYIGTFQVISTYDIRSKSITVNTFVRLGDGYTLQAEIYQPIYVTPYVISVNLGYGQSTMSHGDDGNYNWTKGNNYGWDSDENHAYCLIAKAKLENTYSYYLLGASTIDAKQIRASGRCYCVYHFVNNIGTWQAALSIDIYTKQVVINTFVRTGDGYSPKNVTKCNIRPAPVQDKWSFSSS